MEADTSIAMPSPSVHRRQSCYLHYPDVGMLPAVKLMQSGGRPVLGEHNSRMVRSDNVVRVAPPDPIRTATVWYVSLVVLLRCHFFQGQSVSVGVSVKKSVVGLGFGVYTYMCTKCHCAAPTTYKLEPSA